MTPAEEAKVATFFAQPLWVEIRHLVAGLSLEEIEAIVRRIRKTVWKDFS